MICHSILDGNIVSYSNVKFVIVGVIFAERATRSVRLSEGLAASISNYGFSHLLKSTELGFGEDQTRNA